MERIFCAHQGWCGSLQKIYLLAEEKKMSVEEKITECAAADYLNHLRAEQEHFVDNSFDPIVSYGEHAAIDTIILRLRRPMWKLSRTELLLADTGETLPGRFDRHYAYRCHG